MVSGEYGVDFELSCLRIGVDDVVRIGVDSGVWIVRGDELVEVQNENHPKNSITDEYEEGYDKFWEVINKLNEKRN